MSPLYGDLTNYPIALDNLRMVWIHRSFQELIQQAAAQRPALVLTGGRQTGKTSLLQHLYPTHSFVTLDLPSHAAMAEKDPELFLRTYSPPVILDEVQYAPQLFRYLKVEIDRNRGKTGQFFLTGSQKFTLMKAVSDSLAGRADVLELETLSRPELMDSQVLPSIEEQMLRGGFPELWQKPELNRERFYSAFVSSYLERDVKGLLNVTQLRDFERFLRACALRSGQLLNKADLARDVGISPSTANAWLSVLVASSQIVMLEPWFSNQTKSLTKTPKLYFADTGLLNFFLNIHSLEEMLRSPYIGALWETFVFSELRKRQQATLGYWSLWFWRDRTREIDFVDDRGGNLRLYEAKWTEYPDPSDATALRYVSSQVSSKAIQGRVIISRTRTPYPLDNTIYVTNLDAR